VNVTGDDVVVFDGVSATGVPLPLHDGVFTTTDDDAELFERCESLVLALTVALFVSVVACCGAVRLSVIVDDVFAARSGRVQVVDAQFHPLPLAVPDSEFVSVTFVASDGPLLATVIVNDTGDPAFTFDCDADIASARSANAPIVTDALPVAVQPLLFTVMPRLTVPAGPAVKMMLFVPAPAVIVPFAIVHVYVVPAGPLLTAAVLPIELGSTLAGAVIVASGVLDVATVFVAVALQPEAFVTVTLYVPAGTVIVCVVAPVDHAYVVKPAPASSVAVVFGHTDAGPLIDAAGAGLIVTE